MADGAPYHVPVLRSEVLGFLRPEGDGLFLDGTVGGGGHTLAVLESCPGCAVIAVDRDPEALAEARELLSEHADRVRFVHCRFDRALDEGGIVGSPLAGVLLDLGVSSHQIDEDRRGFTFRPGAPLDMRMTPDPALPTAAELLERGSREELATLFQRFGDEPRGWRLAGEVVRRREEVGPLETSDDLVAAMAEAFGRDPSPQDRARIFQALRIAVNGELEALEAGLPKLRDALAPGGVMVVIAYHSLEDRIVKVAFREWSRACVCPPEIPVCTCRGRPLGETLTRKPVEPTPEEVEENPRARSARLRAWRRAA